MPAGGAVGPAAQGDLTEAHPTQVEQQHRPGQGLVPATPQGFIIVPGHRLAPHVHGARVCRHLVRGYAGENCGGDEDEES